MEGRHQEVRKIGAFIRSEFSIDPYSLDDDQFLRLGQEALFLIEHRRMSIKSVIDNKLNLFLNTVLRSMIK